MPGEPGYVYRTWNVQGRLLYVGCSIWPPDRIFKGHRYKPWYRDVESITIDRHPDLESARRAELQAIHTEWPLWNQVGSPDGTAARQHELDERRTLRERLSRPPAVLRGAAKRSHEQKVDLEIWRQVWFDRRVIRMADRALCLADDKWHLEHPRRAAPGGLELLAHPPAASAPLPGPTPAGLSRARESPSHGTPAGSSWRPGAFSSRRERAPGPSACPPSWH